MRRALSGTCPSVRGARAMSTPGWQTASSTKDVRSREQREADRKARQLEKLPKPEALPTFQFPMEKTLLSDHMFQPPLYETELDTPHLFNLHPPSDFFLYWNVADFDRTDLPAVPDVDHRLLGTATPAWAAHRDTMHRYLRKHGVVPSMFSSVAYDVNASVVFEAEADVDAEDPLNRRNFWRTAHAGNFVELAQLQDTPVVRFGPGTNPEAKYTLVVASPDYPVRGATSSSFFLNYVAANVSAKNAAGDAVVSYVPPLPTEDAGTARVLCMLFEQPEGKRLPAALDAGFSFESRQAYRMHTGSPGSEALAQVEQALPDGPASVTMLQTSWDIQVQEWYERLGRPEPAYFPEDIADVLAYNAQPRDAQQVQSRKLADGGTNEGDIGEVNQQPVFGRASMAQAMLSKRTLLSKAKRPYVIPRL